MMLLSMSMLAAGTSLVVELTNGQTANYLLQDQPTLTIDGTLLKISTATVQTNYERADVRKFYFTEETTNVKDVAKNALVFKQTDANQLEISGLSQGERITVCDMAGRTLGNVSHINEKAVVDLNGQPKGAYIIKIGNSQTIKIIK